MRIFCCIHTRMPVGPPPCPDARLAPRRRDLGDGGSVTFAFPVLGNAFLALV